MSFIELAMRTLPDSHGYRFDYIDENVAGVSLHQAMNDFIDAELPNGDFDIGLFKTAGNAVDQIKRAGAYGKYRAYPNTPSERELMLSEPTGSLISDGNVASPASYHIYHMILGIVTEVLELAEVLETGDYVNLAEEIGDAYWYIAGYAKYQRGTGSHGAGYAEYIDSIMNLETVHPRGNQTEGGIKVLLVSDALSDLFTWLIHFDESAETDLDLMNSIDEIEMHLRGIAYSAGLSTKEVGNAVIEKLKTRYPDKFDADKAVNRDLANEREVLERVIVAEPSR